MNEINKLGLRITGITLVAVALLYGIFWGGKYTYQKFLGDKTEKEQLAQNKVTDQAGDSANFDTSQDTDGDGIPDSFEIIYRTNPDSKDTDSDGASDLDEITIGRDPLTPGPNDELMPDTGSKVASTDTFTDKYLFSLPTDAAQEDILSTDNLTAFVDANKGDLTPALPEGTILVSDASGKEAVSKYLDSISTAQNKELAAVSSDDIDTAFKQQVADPQALKDILAKLENNVAILKKVQAPKEAEELHGAYVAASQALADNVKLLIDMPNDFVGGLIGAKKIGELGVVFEDLAAQVETLEAKYGIQ
ncbi:MAG: hypothetical protein Q8P73_01820 [bacterium]|nr:hypothetical protein [bacterium]